MLIDGTSHFRELNNDDTRRTSSSGHTINGVFTFTTRNILLARILYGGSINSSGNNFEGGKKKADC